MSLENDIPSCFSQSYQEARTKFIAASEGVGVLSHYRNEAYQGREGEDLYMDCLRIGAENAKHVLFVSSATHGVEGFCGSGVQSAWLLNRCYEALPSDTAVVLVHGINAYGFSHLRRVNESNIDLNRNFVDFTKPRRVNSAYETLHSALVPSDWHGPSYEAGAKELVTFIKAQGGKAFQEAASGGQYSQPSGIFYGGSEPSWSNLTLRELIKTQTSGAEQVGMIDIHTGLGPYGHGELLMPGDAASLPRARTWYGDDVTSTSAGDSVSADVNGSIESAFDVLTSGQEFTCVALEFGTLSMKDVMEALRGDNWLHAHGKLDSEQGRDIKQKIKAAFYCDEDDWKQMIWARSSQCIAAGLAGLQASR